MNFFYTKIKRSVLLSTFFIFSTSSLFSYFIYVVNPIEFNGFSNSNKFLEIFIAIIVAPIIETVIFYWIPYNFIEHSGSFKYKKIIFICASSLFFALSHLYNINYFIETLYTGFLMADYYYFHRKNKRVFLNLVIIHSLYNLLVFVLNFILN